MTRKEAIEVLRKLPIGLMDLSYKQKSDLTEALNIALAALRGPTQEQVKKAWRGEWKVIGADKRGRHGIPYCMRCEKCNPYKSEFCPHCGSPMTDEAVEITLQRLEALHENDR